MKRAFFFMPVKFKNIQVMENKTLSEKINKYSAKNRRSVLEEKYGRSREWQLFALRICKNYHLRNIMIAEQNKMCPVCDEPLKSKGVMHHIDYDHYCQRDHLIKYAKRFTPNCRVCLLETPEYFQSCRQRLVVVHSKCHLRLHSYNTI